MAREVVSASDLGVDIDLLGQPDRFHNQRLQDPESFGLAVEALEESIRTLEARLASVNAELEGKIAAAEAHGDLATRRLAMEVVEMGVALSGRIRAIPATPAAPKARAAWFNPLTAVLSGALAAALALLAWTFTHPPAAPAVAPARALARPPPAPALYAPPPKPAPSDSDPGT